MKNTNQYYGHFQDFVSVYVGPFNTRAAVREHAKWCKRKGDGGELIEIVMRPPADADISSPEEDRLCIELGDKAQYK